jgi:hypothetical protein
LATTLAHWRPRVSWKKRLRGDEGMLSFGETRLRVDPESRDSTFDASAISIVQSATADLNAQARNPYSRWWL